MDWNDVRYFLALARSGSVRAAGKSLGVSHSTVARRVEALEAELHTRLFDRSQDGYVLTAAGREMVGSAEGVEREIAGLERVMVGQDGRLAGTVAVTCGDSFVATLLVRALARLCQDHPGVELRFVTDGRPFDLARREADLAVRVLTSGTSPPEHLLGTRVAPLMLASYVARAGGPERWLGFDDRRTVERLVAGSSRPELPIWGSFSSLEAVVEAARAGLGLAMLPVYVGDPDPALRRLDATDARHVADLWLLCHPDLRHTARVQAARGVIAELFREREALFRGECGVP
jgi:DNA-binding transcriptional LysR family regulator